MWSGCGCSRSDNQCRWKSKHLRPYLDRSPWSKFRRRWSLSPPIQRWMSWSGQWKEGTIEADPFLLTSPKIAKKWNEMPTSQCNDKSVAYPSIAEQGLSILMGAANISTKVFDEWVQMLQENTSSPCFQGSQTPPIVRCRTFYPTSITGKLSLSMSFDETGHSLTQFPWQRSHQFGSGSFTTKTIHVDPNSGIFHHNSVTRCYLIGIVTSCRIPDRK